MGTHSEAGSEIRVYGRWASALAGLREITPIMLSAAPFGIVCGVSALEAGLTPLQALAFSFAIFAGASQLISTQLMAGGAPAAMVILAALAVNLRFVMYSASISPYFAKQSVPRKLLISYLLTDQAFAISLQAFNDPRRRVARLAYYMGAAIGMFFAFQAGVVVGILMGTNVAAKLGLEFSVPLIFLALLIPSLKHKSMYVSVAVAVVLTLALLSLPYMLGVFIAAILAIAAGYLHKEAAQRSA